MQLPKAQLVSTPGYHATPLSLRRNFSWTFGSNLMFGACQWAMLAVLAKLVSPDKVGEYSYALAITAPIYLFASLSLSQVQATDAKRIHSFGEYFGLRLVMLVLSIVATFVIAAIIHPSHEVFLVIILVSVSKLLDYVTDIMYGFQQQRERMDYIGISRTLQAILQFVLLGIVVWLTRSVVWGAATLPVISGLMMVFYNAPMTARVAGGKTGVAPSVRTLFHPSWDLPRLWTLARLSLPLGFVALFGMLNVNIPRYFVQDHIGLRELGIFSAMWSMLHPVGLISGSIISSVTPRMARYYVESLAQFNRMLGMLLGLAVVSGLVGVILAHFFGRAILSTLFRPAYAEHPVTFQWMMAAAGMTYIASALGAATTAARSYVLQPYIFFVAMLSIFAACSLLVPHYGVLGAAWSYLVGCTVLAVGFGILITVTLVAAKRAEAQTAKHIPTQT